MGRVSGFRSSFVFLIVRFRSLRGRDDNCKSITPEHAPYALQGARRLLVPRRLLGLSMFNLSSPALKTNLRAISIRPINLFPFCAQPADAAYTFAVVQALSPGHPSHLTSPDVQAPSTCSACDTLYYAMDRRIA
ncbi:unnamed protein product [Peniophora sp. CBMAI 1063]|nr:unnamed protein product [Peniophora sp. CBMAI 1063]